MSVAERFLARVILIANPLAQAMRAGDADLGLPLGEGLQKVEIRHQAERSHGQLALHHAVVEIVIELLGRPVDLHSGKPFHEVVDHVVAARLAVGDDVQAGDFLVLNRSLGRRVIDLVQIVTADPPGEIFGLQALQPARHGVAADHRDRESGSHLFSARRVENGSARSFAVVERSEAHVVSGALRHLFQ